jgi:MFS transporter, DHA1 family, tetracycline resistance protein
MQSIMSNAVDQSRQGESMGAVTSINSIAAVVGPLLAAPLLASVSHFPQGDWRIGLPFYFCAAVQGLAAFLAIRHFAKHRYLASATAV